MICKVQIYYIVILCNILLFAWLFIVEFYKKLWEKKMFHFFFSEVNFYCSYVDYFVDGFVFSNPQIENNKNMFWDAAHAEMCFNRKFTFKPSPFN